MKAFPHPKVLEVNKKEYFQLTEASSGMDLRDYFAAKAMQGYIANTGVLGGISPTDEDLARYSYELADAMMEARNDS